MSKKGNLQPIQPPPTKVADTFSRGHLRLTTTSPGEFPRENPSGSYPTHLTLRPPAQTPPPDPAVPENLKISMFISQGAMHLCFIPASQTRSGAMHPRHPPGHPNPADSQPWGAPVVMQQPQVDLITPTNSPTDFHAVPRHHGAWHLNCGTSAV